MAMDLSNPATMAQVNRHIFGTIYFIIKTK